MDFILDPNLLLYLPLYQLDGASFMSKDAHGYPCSVTGALWRPTGRYFDGADDGIDCGTAVSLDNEAAGTILAWFKPARDNNLESLVSKATGITWATIGIWLYLNQGDIRWSMGDGTTYDKDNTILALVKDVFQCAGITWDGTRVKGYVNGAEESDDAQTKTPEMTGGNLKVGIVSSAYDFQGYIGEVWIYNRALSAIKIARIYNTTKWRYR